MRARLLGSLAAAAVLAVVALAPPAIADDEEAVPLAWKLAAGKHLDVRWEGVRDSDLGAGRVREKREVRMRWTAPAAIEGRGRLDVALREVAWIYETERYEVRLTFREGEAATGRWETRPGVPASETEAIEAEATSRFDDMKRAVLARYAVEVRSRERSRIVVDGGDPDAVMLAELFEGLYLHPPLPADGVRAGLRWDLDRDDLPPLLSSGGRPRKMPEFRVSSIARDRVLMRANHEHAFSGIEESFNGWPGCAWATLASRIDYAGKDAFRIEVAFSPKGHLVSAKRSFEGRAKAKVLAGESDVPSKSWLEVSSELRVETR